MSELREYRYVVNGVVTTAMLNEQDAARLKATPVSNAADSAGATDTAAVTSKAREVPNAARVAPNKGR